MIFLILILSFFMLIKGADLLVDTSIDLSKYMRVPPLIVGLTVVAFGTTAPEIAVNSIASIQNKNDIILGNVIGSNIANIGFVIGLTSLIYTLKADKSAIRIDIPFTFISGMVFLLLGMNGLIRTDGFILLFLLLAYLYYLWINGKANRQEYLIQDTNKSLIVIAFYLFIAIISVVLGARWVIDCSIEIALMLGFSQLFVGITMVSIGTSLPELVTTLVACSKHNDSLATGNIIGSNIFNILAVLSISSIISPINYNTKIIVDITFMLVLVILLLIYSYTNRKVSRIEGSSLLILYIMYFIFIYYRN